MPQDITSFIMIDFYDYESQTTPLMTGVSPDYNMAATFKVRFSLVPCFLCGSLLFICCFLRLFLVNQVKVDDFLLRYFATEPLMLELNQVTFA